MPSIVSNLQIKEPQTDTIKLKDSIYHLREEGTSLSVKNVLIKKLEKPQSSLVKKIEEGYDATSYFYSQKTNKSDLVDYFLHKDYFQEFSVTNRHEVLSISKTNKTVPESQSNNFELGESDVLLMVLIVLLSLIGFVRITGKSYLQRTMSSLLSFTYSNMLFNESNRSFRLNDIILMLVFYVSAGIVGYTTAEYLNIPLSDSNKLIAYLEFVIVIFVLINSYKIVMTLLGLFTSRYKLVSEHLFYVNNIMKFLGILNVILLFAILFAPENSRFAFILLILFVVVISYITRVFKIISDFLTNQFSLFYMILYFCALEIIPIIMIGKIFYGIYLNDIKLHEYLF